MRATLNISFMILTSFRPPSQHRSGARASGVKALYLARLAGLKEEKDLEKNIQTDMEGLWLKVPAVKAWVLASTVSS